MALRTSSAVVAKDCFPNPLRTWGAICRGSKSGHSKVEINVDKEVHVVANTQLLQMCGAERRALQLILAC